ncbi:hypothetical protein [Tunturiibacter gelidiferens]|uniref:hypothetical protein n=1 Tax=Tunturiibacter gelidiferens TaxID=3069689 RepID=UPI003D9ABF63
MTTGPKRVQVSDPVVSAVEPVPTIESSDDEPFMLRQRSNEETADYDKGSECGQKGGQNDDTESHAWQRGWAEAQE